MLPGFSALPGRGRGGDSILALGERSPYNDRHSALYRRKLPLTLTLPPYSRRMMVGARKGDDPTPRLLPVPHSHYPPLLSCRRSLGRLSGMSCSTVTRCPSGE